ncbi:transposase [Clostridium sp. BJN0013]|uniref:transposase n=1 Tax=Clostridium sp. BJN0013 TaxID=3236840 RepID=UPI0034C65D3A
MSGNGKRYNAEFRSDAIKLVLEKRRFVNSAAKDLGINDQTLRNWVNSKNETSAWPYIRLQRCANYLMCHAVDVTE